MDSHLLDVDATASVILEKDTSASSFRLLLNFWGPSSPGTPLDAPGLSVGSPGLLGSCSGAVSHVPKCYVIQTCRLLQMNFPPSSLSISCEHPCFCSFFVILGAQGNLLYKYIYNAEKIFSQITCSDFDSEKSVYYTYC